MSSAPAAAVSSPSPTVPRAEYEALQTQVHALKSQLEWFKRQLFGSKSEKRRVLDPAIQADLLARLAEAHRQPSRSPTRGARQNSDLRIA